MRFYTKTHRHYCGIDLHARVVLLYEIEDVNRAPISNCVGIVSPAWDPSD